MRRDWHEPLQRWIVSGLSCTYTVQACIAAAALHQTDTNPGNNCTQDQGLICLDQDGDGIADGGGPSCNGPDNCPTSRNPGQQDSDGDGIGDACDSTPTHDVGVKYVILVGPAAINLSDTNGRYMWVIAEIGNFTVPPHVELVHINIGIVGAARQVHAHGLADSAWPGTVHSRRWRAEDPRLARALRMPQPSGDPDDHTDGNCRYHTL